MLPSILHLSHFDEYGGSARSARNIHTGLRELGIRSRMLVGRKEGDDPDVRRIASSRAIAFADRAAHRLADEAGLQYVANASSFLLRRHPWFREADVLQLFNIHGGWFALTALPLVTRAKPTVWRLSDMWAMTGHCGYSLDSERWRTGCGSCPHLDTYPAVRRDATSLNWRLKRRVYARAPLTLVAPTRWLEQLTRESPLLAHYPVRVIPNGVEDVFLAPLDGANARASLGLPDRPVVLVASLEQRKGGLLLEETLSRVAAELPLTVLVMGARGVPVPAVPGGTVRDLGVLDDQEQIRRAYAAADVLLHPSLADNLPNAILEGMAAGLPVVALRAGGVSDAVDDGTNGYLAERPDPRLLSARLLTILRDPEARQRMGDAARATILGGFTSMRQARAFASLYEEILGDGECRPVRA